MRAHPSVFLVGFFVLAAFWGAAGQRSSGEDKPTPQETPAADTTGKAEPEKPPAQARKRVVLPAGDSPAVRRRVVVPAGDSPASTPPRLEAEAVPYQEGDTELEGWLVRDASSSEPRSAVLVIHDWTGLQDFTKERTRKLAEMGYVAFAVDIYGKGIRPANPQEAAAEASKYKNNRVLYRKRLLAGLEELRRRPEVRPERIAVIGYCFGGTGALELARAGADVRGVVSFHGGLDSPAPEDGKNIRCSVLLLHGADDPYVPADGIAALLAELNAAKVDWQMNTYSGAVHAFTNPAAGDDNSKGAAYNARADALSWEAMGSFLDSAFFTVRFPAR